MTPLTQCDLRANAKTLLRPGVLLRLAIAAGVAVTFATALTHLRLRTRDLQIECSKLQKERLALISHRNTVMSEVEKLKRYGRLREYAEVKLGLRECPPDRSARMVVSPRALERWRDLLEEDKAGQEDRLCPPSERLMAVVAEKVVSWSSVSLAREPLGESKK